MASPGASTAAPRLLLPILVAGLIVGLFVVLAWPTTGSGGRPQPRPVATRSAASGADPRATSGDPATPRRVEAEAAGVLRAWDRQRAAAWAAGDATALAALYVPGASAGRADAAMLADWTARGLAVDRLTTQLLGVQVLAHGRRR